jgi:hypothetical protein
MKWHSLLVLVLCAATAARAADGPRTMRLDFYHTGNSRQELFALDQVALEPLPWPGNPKKPLGTSNLGAYFFEVIDKSSKKVLYSRGFCSVYGEWVTTAEARTSSRTFHESLRFPAPSAPVHIVVRKRDADNRWCDAWTVAVDPKDSAVNTAALDPPGPLLEIEKNGPPESKVDLLFLGDGYTAAERKKFEADARRLFERLMATPPFKDRRKDFNAWGLCPPARESGISQPSTRAHRASPLGATYDALGLRRYILTFDNKAVRRAASFAPYDFIVILANSRDYGGGGIFGLYCTVAVDNTWASYVFVHEFGHHFAGLSDEYYTARVTYLPPTRRVEPWEPNVTALLDPAKLKWKSLVAAETPLPTPWQKDAYEARSRKFQAQRAATRKAAKLDDLFAEELRVDQQFFKEEKHAGKVGAFEGANYQAKGYYRSELNCIMFTRAPFFCSACRRAITDAIDLYAAVR